MDFTVIRFYKHISTYVGLVQGHMQGKLAKAWVQMASLGMAGIEIHVIHIIHVIISYTLKSLSSLT